MSLMPLDDYTIIGPLCYQGKKDCDSSRCTRMFTRDENGKVVGSPDCMGYHCSYCDAPCSSQGHRCDVGETLLAESKRILDEGSDDLPPAA